MMTKEDEKSLEKEIPPAGVAARTNFIREIVEDDLKTSKYGGNVHTRFPPEPNGYLHIGHAKSICLNFGIARDYNGVCNLRFDDTNPTKEEQEYVDSIIRDVHWLGFDWGKNVFYASDYFEKLYDYAVQLIKKEKAYVCDLTADQIREYRGTLTEPGKNSPFRDRTVDDNLDLFQRMRNGEFPNGVRTLRAKIDMASPNFNLRDPIMYRILHAEHHRTGNAWKIYPTYDWAHGQSDSIEGITHSICTLEFEIHRPLYDWFLDALGIHHPQQIEFARLNLTYTVMSKRKLLELVEGKFVNGWDDPRMPSISGLRRRGFTPESIRDFAERIGISKREYTSDVLLLEDCLRDDLNKRAPRVMAVLRPLKVIIDNYPEGQVEQLEAINNPEDAAAGSRQVPFSKTLYIEQDDFREDPPKKYFRLSPGTEVRLRYAYIIKCVDVVKDEKTGEITELHCTYDPETKSGMPQSSRKVKGTIHWVSAAHALDVEVRLYDRLFRTEDPNGDDWKDYINPHSLEVVRHCKAEPGLANATPQGRFQFERLGYFCVDDDSKEGALVFNRAVTLRDTWAKIEKA
ncbi:MAG: glutamine--tRNA ligase/YqeY domain fusion protein [bacterium]